MSQLLEGRVAVITGAARARGIGKATARLFAEHGARVVITDLQSEDPAGAASEIGKEHLGLVCDIRDKSACEGVITHVLARTGRLDILVNNAGVTQKRTVEEISAEDFDLVTDVSLRGTLYMSQAAIPAMKAQKRGSIVCISSLSALQGGGVFGGAHYCAAKAGVLGLARAMARELGPSGIRVNSITPGLTVTDFSRGGSTDERKNEMASGYPLQRPGQPAEIASASLFLASDLSSYITGATIDVNGGSFIHA
jgi:NAD(P)-dependent dehydrogenase (short-subunit alcohol dehydrogenase family)